WTLDGLCGLGGLQLTFAECSSRSGSEPAAAISDPPAHKQQRNGRDDSPHEWKRKVGNQAEDDENRPKDFSFQSIASFPNCQHSSSADSVVLQGLESFVRLLQLECLHLRLNRNLGCDAQEIN